MKPVRAWVVIPAAGSGTRLQSDRPKQYLPLLARSVLWHSVQPFTKDLRFSATVLALTEADPYFADAGVALSSRVQRVVGGATRQASVLAALEHLSGQADNDDWIFVHDAARPCLTALDIDVLFSCLKDEAIGAVLAAPVADTLKRASENGRCQETVERAGLFRALTPQVFGYQILRRALREAQQNGEVMTDDAGAVERLGLQAKLVRGRDDNLKITQGQDLLMAEQIMRMQLAQGLR